MLNYKTLSKNNNKYSYNYKNNFRKNYINTKLKSLKNDDIKGSEIIVNTIKNTKTLYLN